MNQTSAALAAALHEAGLEELALEAEDGQYAPPFNELVRYLNNIGTRPALLMAKRIANGEFSGTPTTDLAALADEWERAADLISERALLGDAPVTMATANTLRACATALRAHLEPGVAKAAVAALNVRRQG